MFDKDLILVEQENYRILDGKQIATSKLNGSERSTYKMKRLILLSVGFCILSMMLIACGKDDTTSKEEAEETSVSSDDSEETEEKKEKKKKKEEKKKEEEKKKKQLQFDRPDAVRGIYSTGHSAGGERFDKLIDLINDTDLNAMVIDIKDDYGDLTYEPEKKSDLADFGQPYIDDPKKMLKELEKEEIYPIARIVVFKDSVLAEKEPDLSFKSGDNVWKNGSDEAFVSPFKKDVWEHNLEVAKEAAEMGFQEIQFDYVRFPEGFENLADELSYDKGDYADVDDSVEARVKAVTDFVAYAEKELEEYDVEVSVDIFGYTAAVDNAPGIGQDLVQIGEHIDVLSSMIYPSHWGEGSLDISKPDLEPYKTIQNYAVKEKEKLFRMDNPPVSRPWIQDFTASWLGGGNYKEYGKEDVEGQIRALNEAGINEYLLWNANNSYTENVDYKPSLDKDEVDKIKQEDKDLRKEIEKDLEDGKEDELSEYKESKKDDEEDESDEDKE